MIESHTVLQRNDAINFTSMCGEIVMMSSDQSEFYGLDDIATDIWNRLEEKKSVQELITELCNTYGIEQNQCITDTSPFLQELVDKKLLLIS
ncbi:MAG: PqqD family protein [Candidatus Electrothrix sp. MAN1_4]|nr:PqqD family protein [Candidatus Electrothrix sp. MAN1_4]